VGIGRDEDSMESPLQQVTSLQLSVKLASAVLGILVIHAAFLLLERILPHHFQQADARYHLRKFVVFVGYVVAILLLPTNKTRLCATQLDVQRLRQVR